MCPVFEIVHIELLIFFLLQFGKPMRVIPAVFQACFTYTLKAKLAPSWNKVGECYIQGRDFITATGLLGAISEYNLMLYRCLIYSHILKTSENF